MKRLLILTPMIFAALLVTAQATPDTSGFSRIRSKTIVFITGAYVSNHCWDTWRTYFESKGYTTYAPAWPHKEGTAAALRAKHPDSTLASLTLAELLDYHAEFIKRLPEKPIVIGHSFGGMISQVMMNRGLVAAVVAIHAVPPSNVKPYEAKFLRSNTKTLGYFTNINKTYMMSFKKWQYAFTNGMTLEEQKASYEELTIPESKRMARGGLSKVAKIDFKKEHVPLLIIAGKQDHCIPYHLVRRNYKKYKSKNSITDFVVKERNHYVLGLPTWKEDAESIYTWLSTHSR